MDKLMPSVTPSSSLPISIRDLVEVACEANLAFRRWIVNNRSARKAAFHLRCVENRWLIGYNLAFLEFDSAKEAGLNLPCIGKEQHQRAFDSLHRYLDCLMQPHNTRHPIQHWRRTLLQHFRLVKTFHSRRDAAGTDICTTIGINVQDLDARLELMLITVKRCHGSPGELRSSTMSWRANQITNREERSNYIFVLDDQDHCWVNSYDMFPPKTYRIATKPGLASIVFVSKMASCGRDWSVAEPKMVQGNVREFPKTSRVAEERASLYWKVRTSPKESSGAVIQQKFRLREVESPDDDPGRDLQLAHNVIARKFFGYKGLVPN
jgi:hypothetical protein